MLFRCYEACAQLGIEFDSHSLPKGPRELLKLAVAVPEADASPKGGVRFNIINRVGVRAMKYADSFFGQCGFIGEVAIAATKAAFGKARYRGCDLLGIMQAAGPEALPIVALISFLVGLILAFVGAIQLAKYGSEIFVADLVGIAMCREMGAIMVGIVMSGRTGAAFAAELGSMKVNEEISAFRTFGISTAEFLVFPRILALVLMFPLLTIFADVIGMLGGFVIGAGMFDISYDPVRQQDAFGPQHSPNFHGRGEELCFRDNRRVRRLPRGHELREKLGGRRLGDYFERGAEHNLDNRRRCDFRRNLHNFRHMSRPTDIADDEVFRIENLTMAYGDYVVMRGLNFSVKRGEIFFIMGGSGCGKSTLLRHMIGLIKPAAGTIYFRGENFSDAPEREKTAMLRQFGVLYQGGALWSSMTLAENVELPLREFTGISARDARRRCESETFACRA